MKDENVVNGVSVENKTIGKVMPSPAQTVDQIEEMNFRLGAFSRAYFGKEFHKETIISRGRLLVDVMQDLATHLQVLINTLDESNL